MVLATILLLAMLSALPLHAQAAAPRSPADPHSIPSIDGALGPCTADFTITDDSGSPVYLAKVSVHIAYGFMNLHKLDLEVSTNIDGKARFTGLPTSVKRGLYFQASESDRSGVAFDDPSATCKTQLPVTLRKSSK